MSSYSYNEVDNYGHSNAGSYFSLKDDGDTARVRFLYGTMDDIQGDVVHEIHTDGDPSNLKSRQIVNCLRSYNEPLEACPLCAAGYKQIPKLYIKLYNEDTNEVQIWERGKSYFQRMASLTSHFNPLYNAVIEITRNGKKGDMKTTYEFFPIETSDFDIDSIDIPEALGTAIQDKSAQDLTDFLNGTGFVSETADVSTQRSETTRRTPTNTTTRRAF